MDLHQTLFAWTEKPTASGNIKLIKEFKELKTKQNKLNFGELIRQVDQLDSKETIKPYTSLEWIEEEFNYLVDHDTNSACCYFINDVLVGVVITNAVNRRKVKLVTLMYISVLPSNSGTGIATLLIGRVFKDYPKHDYCLTVHSNNPEALAVYERMGFKPKLINMELANKNK